MMTYYFWLGDEPVIINTDSMDVITVCEQTRAEIQSFLDAIDRTVIIPITES